MSVAFTIDFVRWANYKSICPKYTQTGLLCGHDREQGADLMAQRAKPLGDTCFPNWGAWGCSPPLLLVQLPAGILQLANDAGKDILAPDFGLAQLWLSHVSGE